MPKTTAFIYNKSKRIWSVSWHAQLNLQSHLQSLAQFMNNQNYSGGFALVVSQAINLPTLPAQGSVATIYITGQYITAQ